MRRIRTLIPLLAILVGCQQGKQDQAAIKSVFEQRSEARKASTVDIGKKKGVMFDGNAYVNALHKIDASACPKKFQLAWLDYVQAWERNKAPINDFASKAEFAVGLAFHSTAAVSDSVERIKRGDTDEAFRQIVRVAAQYDVTVPAD